MTPDEIIKETVEYYGEDPEARRASDEGSLCDYLKDDGRMCAVGRCLTPKELSWAQDVEGGVNWLLDESPRILTSLDEILQEQYRGHPIEFWEHLQDLHDRNLFWNQGGLSDRGHRQVQWLLEERPWENNTEMKY